MLGEKALKRETQRLKEFSKIDGLIGAENVGAVIDLYNEMVDKQKEKEYNDDMSDRNKYYAPLWKRAIEEYALGHRSPPKVHASSSSKKKIYLPNNKDAIVVK